MLKSYNPFGFKGRIDQIKIPSFTFVENYKCDKCLSLILKKGNCETVEDLRKMKKIKFGFLDLDKVLSQI